MKRYGEATSKNFDRILKKAIEELKKENLASVNTVTITGPAAKKVEKIYAAGTPKPDQLDARIIPALKNIIRAMYHLNDHHHAIKQGLGPYKNVWADDMLRNFHIMYNIEEAQRLITVLYIGDHPGNPAYSF